MAYGGRWQYGLKESESCTLLPLCPHLYTFMQYVHDVDMRRIP